jgi:serine/threonine-protein kinase SRK2
MNRGAKPEPLLDHPRYEKIRDLNSGTFGFVQLARDKQTGELIAVKFIERGDKVTKYVEREIINHRCLVHPHIVQFKEVFLTTNHLAIAMEFASGGDMFEYVVKKNGLREDEARWFFQQLIVGLDYCHRMGVVNRDIKLENTLLDSSPRPLVKICDFGYSKHEKFQSAPGSRVGTPAYLAPEVILTTRGKTYDGKIADIWSCGVMLYVMLVGAYPFERPEDKHDNQKLQKMIQRILHVDYAVPSHIRVSDDCKDLLKKVLVADPAKRITVEGIYNHPWYCKNLPPGVKEMNDRPQPLPDGLQTVEQVTAIVQESRKAGVPGYGNFQETDEYIDDAMDSWNEASLDYNE